MKFRTHGWPESRVAVIGKPRTSGRLVEFSYTYTVQAERYGGSYRKEFADVSDAECFLKPFDLGASKYVRYHPRDPRKHWLVE
jgi:hypothetical protein